MSDGEEKRTMMTIYIIILGMVSWLILLLPCARGEGTSFFRSESDPGSIPSCEARDVINISRRANETQSSDAEFLITTGNLNNCRGNSVKQTADGGYIVVGDTWIYGGNIDDLLLLRYDAHGNLMWSKIIGGRAREWGNSLQLTADGGYVVTGICNYFGRATFDILLVKFDAADNLVFASAADQGGDEIYQSVQQTSDGGYIVTGYVGLYSSNWAREALFLLKFDASGNLSWGRNMGDGGFEAPISVGNDVQQTADGGYIVTGYTWSYGAGLEDVLLLKYDASGNIVWARTAGEPDADEGNSVQQTADGGYIVAGTAHGPGYSDVLLIKYDAAGEIVWARTSGGPAEDTGNFVRQTADGGYIVTGHTQSYGAGAIDLFLLKYDEFGNLLWARTAGGFLPEEGCDVQQTTDGGYIISGFSQSYNALGNCDAFLLKTDADGFVGDCSIVTSCSPESMSPVLKTSAPTIDNVIPTFRTGTPVFTSVESTLRTTMCGSASSLGVTLTMPDTYFTPADECSLTAQLTNPGPQPLANVCLVILLDLGTGDYWFAPSWRHYPEGADYYFYRVLSVGFHEELIIPSFQWPEDAGSLGGLRFWGALTLVDLTTIRGDIGEWVFGYGQ